MQNNNSLFVNNRAPKSISIKTWKKIQYPIECLYGRYNIVGDLCFSYSYSERGVGKMFHFQIPKLHVWLKEQICD